MNKDGFGRYLIGLTENPRPPKRVRFPEAYRRRYWALLDALDAQPVPGSYHDDEDEAERRTTAALDVFEDDNPDQGPEVEI